MPLRAPLRSKAAANRRGALLPSLLALLVFLASSHNGLLRGADAQFCDDAFADCQGHDMCTKCVFAFDQDATCDEYTFDNANNCDLFGVSYCCAAKATGDLEACLTDGYTIEYWECILGQHGCSITDMPCFNSDDRTVVGAEDSGAARGTATTSTAAAAVALAVAFAAACSAGSAVGL